MQKYLKVLIKKLTRLSREERRSLHRQKREGSSKPSQKRAESDGFKVVEWDRDYLDMKQVME